MQHMDLKAARACRSPAVLFVWEVRGGESDCSGRRAALIQRSVDCIMHAGIFVSKDC